MKKTLWVVLALAVISTKSFGGTADGAGGDWESVEFGSAWFLGDKTVTYCYEGDLGLGKKFEKKEIEKTLNAAFEAWKKYLAEKQVYTDAPAVKRDGMQLILNHKLLPDGCDGSENIKFYLGVDLDKLDQKIKADIKNEKAKYSNAMALVKRTDFNDGFGKGYMYITPHLSLDKAFGIPNWEVTGALQGIVMHELGHILGCDHVNGTIMSSNLARVLLDFASQVFRQGTDVGKTKDGLWRLLLTSIDQQHELFHNPKVKQEHVGMLSWPQQSKLRADQELLFEHIMDRKAKGPITAKFTDGEKMFFEIGDDGGSKSFPVKPSYTCDEFEQGRIFKVARKTGLGYQLLSVGSVCDAIIQLHDRKLNVHIQIVRNSRAMARNQFVPESLLIQHVGQGARGVMFTATPDKVFEEKK